jgi:hypothetical protein
MLLVLYLYLKETNFWDASKIVTCFLSFFLASVETTNFWYPLKFVTFLRMFVKTWGLACHTIGLALLVPSPEVSGEPCG